MELSLRGQVLVLARGFQRGTVFIAAFSLFWVSFSAGAAGASVQGTVRIGSDPGEGAVVYLKENGSKPAAGPKREVTIRQENLAFSPPFIAVLVGSTILFENLDSEMHNVHSTSAGNRFDTGAHNKGDIKTVILERAGAVMLRCKIHTQMRGMVFVSPTPYFAVAGKDGRYELPKVPPGDYQIEVWHPRLTPQEIKGGSRPVTVGAKVAAVDFNLIGKAPKEANLTDVPDRDWMEVVGEIGASLDQAIRTLKEGKRTGAMTKVMTTHSRIYGESGLRNVIVQKLGSGRAELHDSHFSALVKQVQNENLTAIQSEKEKLLTGLKEDIQKMK